VQIPESLKSKNPSGYDHREAVFGLPPYGGSIEQPLYYANSDFCTGAVSRASNIVFHPTRPKEPPFLLMVNRGGCTFVKKVRNAQHMGAAGVLIADNVCLCSDEACLNQTSSPTCEKVEPMMADDGSGSDITIPSFLVYKHDAEMFKDHIVTKNQTMRVAMEFESAVSPIAPSSTSTTASSTKTTTNTNSKEEERPKVSYELWMSPTDAVSKDFLTKFGPIAKELGPYTNFTPHLYIYDGIKSQCVGQPGSKGGTKEENKNWEKNPCFNLCTNHGRYCSTDPDDDLYSGISGADVVKESLRLLCIWSNYGDSDGLGVAWWSYIQSFYEKCFSTEAFADRNCINKAYLNAGISGPVVDQCMADSGGLTADEINNKLYREISVQYNRGIYVMPSVHIQGRPFRGPVAADAVLSAICDKFTKKPEICQCAACPDPAACAADGGRCRIGIGSPPVPKSSSSTMAIEVDSTGGVSPFTFISSVLMLAFLAIGVAGWHYKRTQDEMNQHVRGILNDYIPLHEDGDGSPNAHRNTNALA